MRSMACTTACAPEACSSTAELISCVISFSRVVARAINDAGEVAGVHRYPDRHTESFRYTSGTAMASIPEGRVSAINNTGQVVGGIPSGSAFLWNAGTLTYLGTLGGTGSQAYAINDLGLIAGSAYMSGNSAMHSFLSNGAGNSASFCYGRSASRRYGCVRSEPRRRPTICAR